MCVLDVILECENEPHEQIVWLKLRNVCVYECVSERERETDREDLSADTCVECG